MSSIKTTVNDASVTDFINAVPDEAKRNDGFTLLELYSNVTGEKAKMWGPSIIGFGHYHYKSPKTNRQGEWMLTGFSPRKQNLTLYFMDGLDAYQGLLKDLGKHKVSGGSCLYITKLADVDMTVLEKLIRASFAEMKRKNA